MESNNKRFKKPNFTDAEMSVMLEEVSVEAACLLSSFQTGVTIKKKRDIWAKITNTVNAVGGNGRTLDQVKKKWKDLKSSVLHKRQESTKTGGGSPKPPIPFEDLVMGIVGSNTNLTSGISEDQTTDTWVPQQTSSPVTHSALESSTSQSVSVIDPEGDFVFPDGTTFQTLDLEMPSTHQPNTSTVTSEIFPNASGPSTSSASVMPFGEQERPASTPPRLQSTVSSKSKKRGRRREIFHHEEAETEDESETLWKEFLRSEIQKNKMKMQLMEEQLRQLKDRVEN